MKKILHLTVFLAVVGALSAGVLSYVNELTAPIIEAQKLAAVQESLEILIPGGSFSELDATEDTGLVTGAYLAEGEGYIYQVAVTGYNASTPIEFMMSFDMEGTITGYVVLSQQETNGIGSRVAEPEFADTVVGTNVNDGISTLSGATISSTAVVNGINAAKALYGAQAGVSVEEQTGPVAPAVVYTLSDDYSGYEPVVTEQGEGVYHVSVHGNGIMSGMAEYGYTDNEFVITVADGKIAAVEFTKIGDTVEGYADQLTADYLATFVGLGLDAEVDAVSGATGTSKSLFAALNAALLKATRPDGEVYSASAQGFGGEVTVNVIVNEGVIVGVEATGPSETQGIGSNAIDQLPAAIVDANSADVDAVAGATVTSEAIKSAVKSALSQVGGESYTATAQGFGGDVTVTVTLNEGVIVAVDIVGAGETQGIGTNAIEQLPAAIISANSAEVDAVAGATVTSGAIKEATQAALDQAAQ